VLAILNLRLAWLSWRDPLAAETGTESVKPPHAFVLWGLQGLVLLVGSLAFVLAPEAVLARISGVGYGSPLLSPLAVDQARLLGALATGMALLSFVAMGTQYDFAWRGFSFFFSCFLAVWVVSIAWILTWGHYAVPVLAVLLPGLLFLPMNVWLFGLHGEWDPAGVSRMPEAWSVIDLVAGPLMGLFVLTRKRRSSHLVGVGARGVFHPAEPGHGVPPNELFAARGARPVQVRFANLTEIDDASLDVRGCSIKFSEHRHESPLDLLLNTGSFCPAYNLWTFAAFVASKLVPTKGSEYLVQNNLVAREGGVAGLRRAPQSYARLYYYGQIVREWVSTHAVLHLVRYRCVPEDLGQESGLPSDDDASHIWVRSRLPGDERPVNYLRQEMRDRLALGPVRMRLQAQFHRRAPGDSLEWFNASVDWNESAHPWHDLGALELQEALEDVDTELLQFDPGNHPVTLGIPSASGPSDYRSMGDSEARVVRALQHLRLWMYGAFGFPSFDPGSRP